MALTTTELAEFTRRSRELMNDGGEHWMKGEYKEFDDFDMLRFCSVGAVRETMFGDADGLDVDILDQRYQRVIRALAEAVREELKAGRYEPHTDAQRSRTLHIATPDIAETVVIDFNDNDRTRWEDVERVFKRAEQTLAAAA